MRYSAFRGDVFGDPIRAVVDTNVQVAGVLSARRRIGSPTREVVDAYLAGQFRAVVSLPLLNELDAVCARPRRRG